MYVIDIEWTHILLWVFVFVFIIFFKYIITYFILLRKHETVVIGGTRTSECDQRRRQIVIWGISARQCYLNQSYLSPPPEFSVAIKDSLPVSYIDVEDPPPKYEECVPHFHIEKESQNKSIQTEDKNDSKQNPE